MFRGGISHACPYNTALAIALKLGLQRDRSKGQHMSHKFIAE